MDIKELLLSIVVLLTVTVIILLNYIWNIKKSLKNIQVVLEDVKNGNWNRRALAKDNDRAASICYSINKIVETNRRQIETLEESEKAYKQLMTSLSHDVRTPLTSLIGYLDAIHNRVVDGKEVEAYFEIARNKAYNLKDLVDMLFEWFKLDSGERIFQFEKVDINEQTRSIIVGWIPVFEKNNIMFSIDIADTECKMDIDINAYTRIINNIIQNSLEHSGANEIGIGIIERGNSALINVFDNGKGIGERELPYIFDRLYKCDKSRSQKGSGLGLSIVKELVTAHNGTISVTSIPNEKTIFSIVLPID